MTTSSKRSAMFGLGIVVLIVGSLAAIGLWYSAGQRESDAVRNLARAPSGCDTTLDFEAAGEFTIFIETAGRFDAPITGDCVADGEYGLLGDSLPPVSLALTAPSGDEVVLNSTSGVTYDADGFSGQSARTFRVETPGDHVLRVEIPDGSDVRIAVAVGRDPSDGVQVMQLSAALAALVGLVIGLALIVISRRSSTAEPAQVATEPWATDPAGWPTAPPGMPAAPAPQGWQPAVGPPSHMPDVPPAPGSPASVAAPPPPTDWPPRPATLGTFPDALPAPSAPAPPSPPPDGGAAPARESASSDGSSGDGQRSPWAPPNDAAH